MLMDVMGFVISFLPIPGLWNAVLIAPIDIYIIIGVRNL